MAWTEDEKEKIKSLKDDVRAIKICLMGRDEDHEDLGLVGDVSENTRFRKRLQSTLNKTTATALGALIISLISIFKQGIKQLFGVLLVVRQFFGQ